MKYKMDDEYRDKVITRAREDYAEKRAKQAKADRRVFKAKGGRLISIGRVAEEINRKVMTVRKYHVMGVIPQPTHFDSRGWRLYTIGQFRLIVSAFDRFDRGILKNLTEVGKELKEKWSDGEED
jgi:hypothetical protein